MDAADRHPFLAERVTWHFPLETTHSGIPLSNGTFGALLHGAEGDLRITVNRADYWDHRGGITWGEEATWDNLQRWLREGDEENLRRVFEGVRSGDEDGPARPTRLPMGRVDIALPAGGRLQAGHLNLGTSEADIDTGEAGGVRAVLVRHDPILALRIAGSGVVVRSVPPDAPAVREYFSRYGLPPAEVFDEGRCGGWVQECPGEPAMCVAWQVVEVEGAAEVLITSVYGETAGDAREQALSSLRDHAEAGYCQMADRTAAWWGGYWSRIAAVSIPDPECALLYYLGMYKLAGLSVPGSPAATLQGPWVEEYCMPPWSGDYHFNINVQECYWPVFAGNFIPALEPLWQMLKRWEPRLRQNARAFLGIDDGLQLPHAVDDRCTCMGGFWTGSVDHGSTSWTGQLMWLQWRYTMDEHFLAETVYPFLKGAMRVYEAMLQDDGRTMSLPVSVSPEFGGSGAGAWGRDASFQLANIHFLCRALIEASERLDIDAEDRHRWQFITERLPLASTDPDGREIWLWDGQPLSESHRHHSHLAGLYPFDIFDYHGSEEHHSLIDASLRTLTRQGMGLWTGWCMPWAAILHARTGNGQMANVLLHTFRRCFMGPGYASTHDARFRGFTLMDGRPEIMQIEAALAAAAAVLELLAQCSQGTIRVFAALPDWWRDVAFEGLRTEGAFLISGRMRNAEVEAVRILSEAGAPLRIVNPFGPSGCIVGSGDGPSCHVDSPVIEMETKPGQTIVLSPAV